MEHLSSVYTVISEVVLVILGTEFVGTLYEHYDRRVVWKMAREYADKVGKPMLNVGCGQDPNFMGDYNLDIAENRIMPNFIRASVYEIPFPDKYFGSVLCSHVLEHLDDPKKALEEMTRVADRVYVVVPVAFKLSTWLHPEHKWVFCGSKVIRNNPVLNLALVGLGIYLVYKFSKSGLFPS